MYVATPRGQVLKYDPNKPGLETGKPLPIRIPFDLNHPELWEGGEWND
jgi:hypothetical protein